MSEDLSKHPANAAAAIDLAIAVGLVLLAAIVFGQTLGHSFVGYDDPVYVTDNPIVQRGLTLQGVRWAFVQGAEANYWTPITYLSHMLDCQLFGMRAGLHHLTSVVLHAINAVLLYFFLLSLTSRRWRWASAFVAALFAVHPLHVESVAWIAERKDLLSGLFFLLTLWAYVNYARRGGGMRYTLVLVLFVLGLMSKPMLVTLPAVMLLLDAFALTRPARWRALIAEKVPLVVLSLAVAAFAVVAQKQAGAMRTMEQFPLSRRLGNTIVSYARYMLKTFWPVKLAVFYPPPERWSALAIIGSLALLCFITVVTYRMRRRVPYALMGWLWFCGMLLPVIGLIQVGRQAMADRYSYLPHIGLFIAITWLAMEWIRSPRVLGALGIVALLACVIRSADQVRYWKDNDTLFTHALAVTPENAIALNEVGNARAHQRDLWGAEALYRRALELDPDYGMAHLNLGHLLVRRRDFAGAAEHYEAALRWRADLPRAQLGLGIAYTGMKKYDRADRAFAEALHLSPWMADAELSWGLSLKERGDFDSARAHLRAALRLNPRLDLARAALAALDSATTSR